MKSLSDTSSPGPALELHRLRDIGSTLIPDEDVSIGSSRAWVLAKPEGKGSFSIDVEFVVSDLRGFSIGITPVSTSLSMLTNIHTAQDSCNLALYRIHFGNRSLYAFEDSREFDISQVTEGTVRRIRVEFIAGETPKLLYSLDNADSVDVTSYLPKPLLPGEYKPCISVASSAARFRCQTTWRKPKRMLEGSCFVSRTSRAMWHRRRYTDIVIRAADGEPIECHRAQLAEGSPVLAAEFDRWAGEKKEVDVNGDRSAVESMIAFFYTGELANTADAAAVLPLAHRYQVDDLVLLAVDRLLESLSAQTVLAAARALRPLRGHGLHLAWRELCARVACDVEMVEVFMLAA